MHPHDRRQFFRTSALGLGAAFSAAPHLLGQAPPLVVPLVPPDGDVRPDSLFLTWQSDPTTTMTVQWLAAGSGSPVELAVSPLGQNAWKPATATSRPYPMTDLRRYRAEFTGLTPGTEYQFKLDDEPAGRFRTMPAKLTDSFSFISGGDCGVNAHAVANNIVAARQDPMFTLVGGDLGYDNGRDAATSIGFIKNYAKHMVDGQGRLIPLVVCIGNHEVNGGYNKTRIDAPFFFALFDGLFHERSYGVLDFGDYLSLVLLDSGHVAPIGGEQADWLDGALKARLDRPHLIVANHVPAYPSFRPVEVSVSTDDKAEAKKGNVGKGTGEGNRQFWVPLFEKYNVDVVLEHHDHTFKRTHPLRGGLADSNGIVYLGDGSWGRLRAPKPPEKRPYLATVSRSYHMTLHRIQGNERFHLALEETGKVVDVCRTVKRPNRV